jgi:hypothetical protein
MTKNFYSNFLLLRFPVYTKCIFHYTVQNVTPLGLILSQLSFHFTPRKCKFSHTICSMCVQLSYTGFCRTAILLIFTGLHLWLNLHIILISSVLRVVESLYFRLMAIIMKPLRPGVSSFIRRWIVNVPTDYECNIVYKLTITNGAKFWDDVLQFNANQCLSNKSFFTRRGK